MLWDMILPPLVIIRIASALSRVTLAFVGFSFDYTCHHLVQALSTEKFINPAHQLGGELPVCIIGAFYLLNSLQSILVYVRPAVEGRIGHTLQQPNGHTLEAKQNGLEINCFKMR
jgi:hypothetical protein